MTKIPILRKSVTKPEKQKEDEGFKELLEVDDGDADLVYPLMPNDPSAGFIEIQGHYIVHFAFFVAISAFVELQDEYSFCFTQTDPAKYEWTMLKTKN